ncbi:ISAs1 family transposase [Petralouisia muris]|uniref:ISAs1 family transposase n=1 Tax=Petralouisia muris TaxID=3032872 RepID=UPI0014423BBA|nr:ISAs1 family transposase [Petralouisia muris]
MSSVKFWSVFISIWRWTKTAFLVKPLAEYFREMPDPRCARKHKHSHVEILLFIALGFLAEKTSLRRIVKWAKRNQEKLKKHLTLENGIPSLSTFSRIACGMDEELQSLAFTDWIGNILGTKGIHIVIDGKVLRAATEKIKDKKEPYILNAMDAATNLVLAQVPIPEKTNEMTAIPKLLEIPDITGSAVTINAIGATEAILRMIEEKSGYFVQQIKKNCPATYQEIQNIFGKLEKEKEAEPEQFAMENKGRYSEYSRCEKNRERVEHREVKCYTNDDAIGKIRKELPFICSIASSCQVRIPK